MTCETPTPEPTDPAGVSALADVLVQRLQQQSDEDGSWFVAVRCEDELPAVLAALRTPPVPEVAKEALAQGAAWFNEYADQHSAKGDASDDNEETLSRYRKSERNRERAGVLLAALQTIGEGQ